MLTRNEILQATYATIIENHPELSNRELLENDRLQEDLGLDSLDVIDVELKMERDLKVGFPDRFSPYTIKDFVDGICGHISRDCS